jgi:L-ascorbate metabolism protein UlaG (beta-lactamase superfamily)
MELTWHGHSTWHVTLGETSLLIDPFFGNPKTDLSADDIETDIVLVTHGHDDHVADVAAFTDATLAGTPEVTNYLVDEHGFEGDVVGFNHGGTVELGEAFVTMHRADHTNGVSNNFKIPDAGPAAGYVISDADPTDLPDDDATVFYHAGDTALMVSMRDIIGPFLGPDAAALPAGDHFTMGPQQASIAADWLGVDYAFPMHYDTFPPIEMDPADFKREVEANAPETDPIVLAGDESFDL